MAAAVGVGQHDDEAVPGRHGDAVGLVAHARRGDVTVVVRPVGGTAAPAAVLAGPRCRTRARRSRRPARRGARARRRPRRRRAAGRPAARDAVRPPDGAGSAGGTVDMGPRLERVSRIRSAGTRNCTSAARSSRDVVIRTYAPTGSRYTASARLVVVTRCGQCASSRVAGRGPGRAAAQHHRQQVAQRAEQHLRDEPAAAGSGPRRTGPPRPRRRRRSAASPRPRSGRRAASPAGGDGPGGERRRRALPGGGDRRDTTRSAAPANKASPAAASTGHQASVPAPGRPGRRGRAAGRAAGRAVGHAGTQDRGPQREQGAQHREGDPAEQVDVGVEQQQSNT